MRSSTAVQPQPAAWSAKAGSGAAKRREGGRPEWLRANSHGRMRPFISPLPDSATLSKTQITMHKQAYWCIFFP